MQVRTGALGFQRAVLGAKLSLLKIQIFKVLEISILNLTIFGGNISIGVIKIKF